MPPPIKASRERGQDAHAPESNAASPRVLGWMRPANAGHAFFCAVLSTSGGSRVTACHGRWPTSLEEEYMNELSTEKKCEGCLKQLGAMP